MELLILLVERRGELVSREEIAERLWGKDVFVEVDRSINTAVSKVRIALRDDPEKPRFVETVVGKGYRFAAPVSCSNGDGDPTTQTWPTEAQSSSRTSTSAAEKSPSASGPASVVASSMSNWLGRPWKLLVAGLAMLAVVGAAFILSRRVGASGTKAPAIRSLAVLPLKNLSGDPGQEYFADGMTEALIGQLSSIQELRVISRTSVMSLKDRTMTVPEIAATLHVDAVVEGSVMREGDRVRVHAQLIRTATDEHFWSETYDREVRDVLALQSEVAQDVAQKVAVTLTGRERSRLVATRHVSPEVYESYLKGQFALRKSNNHTDLEESIRYFDDAIRQDPTFAGAYIGLANAYDALGLVFVGGSPAETRPKVISAALKALDLDPELAEAHVQLAEIYRKEWRWSDAEAEYKRALQLRPNDAGAHLGFAMWLLAEGRTEEAMEWSERARELDPLVISGADLAWILFSARRYDEAIRELRATLSVRPDDAQALWFLGFSLIGKGKPEEAIPPLEQALSISKGSPGVIGVLARAYGHVGRRSDALRLIADLSRRRQKGYVPTAPFVQAYVGLGNYDEAFAWFERAYQEKSNILQWLKVEPFPDALRNDPRFADLVRRVGLEETR